jgi:hypothetical protein
MAKRFIITEEEKNDIKSLYNITEQSDFLKQLAASTLDSLLSDGNAEGKESEKVTNVSEKGQELLNNPIFKEKLTEISNAISISENSIIKLMNHESGLDPKIENTNGCVGLIQFCPDNSGGSTKTINGKVYNLEELKNNLELQMDVIKDFWVSGKNNGKIKSPKDLYIYNFFPVAAGKPNDYVLQTDSLSAEKIANQNPIFNSVLGRNRNTPLTVGDLETFYRKQGMV